MPPEGDPRFRSLPSRSQKGEGIGSVIFESLQLFRGERASKRGEERTYVSSLASYHVTTGPLPDGKGKLRSHSAGIESLSQHFFSPPPPTHDFTPDIPYPWCRYGPQIMSRSRVPGREAIRSSERIFPSAIKAVTRACGGLPRLLSFLDAIGSPLFQQ